MPGRGGFRRTISFAMWSMRICGGGIRKALGSWMAHSTVLFWGTSGMSGAAPPTQREIFDLWSGHPATRTFVARRPDGAVCGVTLIIEMDQVDDMTADQDP